MYIYDLNGFQGWAWTTLWKWNFPMTQCLWFIFRVAFIQVISHFLKLQSAEKKDFSCLSSFHHFYSREMPGTISIVSLTDKVEMTNAVISFHLIFQTISLE